METSYTAPPQLDWVKAFPAYQAALRNALCGYLDGRRRYLTCLGRPTNLRSTARSYLGPLEKVVGDLLRVEAPASSLLSKVAGSVQALFHKGHVGELEFAQVIADGYRAAEALIGTFPMDRLRVQQSAAPEPIDPRDYQGADAPYLAPVLGLDQFAEHALRSDVTGFFLHGSLATLDYARDYSDLDTLMVLKRATVVEPERLVSFARRYRRSLTFIYQFDPLQHHGHILLTEIDLGCYPNAFFPLSVLEQARSLGGGWAPLTVRYRDDRVEMTAEFAQVCSVFSRRAGEGYRPNDPFDLKNFLSELMLLPALYCQCLGSPCYKKFSFRKARPDFAHADWDVMEQASLVRSQWHYGRKTGGLVGLAGRWLGSVELLKARGKNQASRVMAQASGLLSPDYVQAAARLAEAMRQRLVDRPDLN
jgi:hypothetical protein